MVFSNQEKRDMMKLFYKSDSNTERTAEMYLQLYPERIQPARTLFKKLDRNLTEYGSFKKPRNKYGNRLDENTRNNIQNAVINFYPFIKILNFFNLSVF